jgi:membrane fusion protein, copper/silver efflux system
MSIRNEFYHGYRGTIIFLLIIGLLSSPLFYSSAFSQESQQLSAPFDRKSVRSKMSFKERLQSRKQMQAAQGSMEMPADMAMTEPTMSVPQHHHDNEDDIQASDGMSTMHKSMQTESGTTPRYWDSSADRPEPVDQHNHEHATGLTPEKPLPSIFKPLKHAMPGVPPIQSDMESGDKYVCPMHPQIVQDGPGSCPICGMDLVAHKTHAPDTKNPKVFLSSAVIQNMGVRVAPVKKNHLHNHIITQGLVTADEDRITNIHPRTAGWIQKLYLLTEGDRVERKDELVDFYSPWINEIQLQFIAALEEYDMLSYEPEKAVEVNSKIDNFINSLRLLNVMDMDIMRIKNTRKVQNTIQLLAPQSGVITDLNIREGTYLEPYQPMFTIVDLSRVWVMIDIYEHQAVSVRKGQQVTITTPAIPSRKWEANIDYIYPEVNPKTRTLKARITLKNPDEALLLNMYVNVDISVSPDQQEVLTVPREAVILTGEREVVIKALDKGHFQPVDITSGMRDNDNVEILSGLNEGDKIVISGQFLIDSESSLQASFLRLSN